MAVFHGGVLLARIFHESLAATTKLGTRSVPQAGSQFRGLATAIEAPCPAIAGLKRDRESSKCKEEIPFYCSSLANPEAIYGECTR